MKEIVGDIWEFHKRGNWIVIPTNGSLNSKGEAIMGKGLALQAKRRFPDIPKKLGETILTHGNVVSHAPKASLIFFPVKKRWYEKASLDLIEESTKRLKEAVDKADSEEIIYLPRVGCGIDTGKLNWTDVKPILDKYLDDRFVVVSRDSGTSLAESSRTYVRRI
jgi:hypothetical protein